MKEETTDSSSFDVGGVNVNLDSPDLMGVQTIEDVQKLNIFGHLPKEEKEDAEKALLDKVLPMNSLD